MRHAALLLAGALAPATAFAAPQFAPVWTDHAVIQRDQPIVGAVILRFFPRADPAIILSRIDDHPIVDAQPRGMRCISLTERRHRGQPENQRARHVSRSRPNRGAR